MPSTVGINYTSPACQTNIRLRKGNHSRQGRPDGVLFYESRQRRLLLRRLKNGVTTEPADLTEYYKRVTAEPADPTECNQQITTEPTDLTEYYKRNQQQSRQT